MIDTKRLRQKILDLAIRGKLVEQDPADEPASVLLERIREEKLQMVADGRLKKKDVAKDSIIFFGDDNRPYEKVGDAEPVCIADEVPFELPDGWSWARLGSIANEPQYGTSRKSDSSGEIPVLRMGNITSVGTIDYSDLAYTSDESDIEKFLLAPGDVIFNRTNSKEWVGKVALYEGAIPAIYAGYLVRFRTLHNSSQYIVYAMCSPYEREWCSRVKTDGVNQSNINVKKLKQFLIPIPPLAEQQRIVAALDEYLALVDEIERNQEDLEELLTKARSKVLDLAIRGKLVEQDPADEPASALLERIREEKLQMVADGKLKKKDVARDSVIYKGEDNSYYEKMGDSEPVCIADEMPFDLPEGWSWAQLGSLCEYLHRGKSPKYSEERKYPVFAQKCNQPNGITLEKVRFADPDTFARYADNQFLRNGDIVINSTGTGTLGRVGLFSEELLDGWPCIVPDSHVTVVRLLSCVPEYIWCFFKSEYGQSLIFANQTGSTNQKELPTAEVGQFLIPLPPYAEQSRIAEMIGCCFSELQVG